MSDDLGGTHVQSLSDDLGGTHVQSLSDDNWWYLVFVWCSLGKDNNERWHRFLTVFWDDNQTSGCRLETNKCSLKIPFDTQNNIVIPIVWFTDFSFNVHFPGNIHSHWGKVANGDCTFLYTDKFKAIAMTCPIFDHDQNITNKVRGWQLKIINFV